MVDTISNNRRIVLILLLAFLLRLINIDQSLWLDEAIGAIAVEKFSYGEIVNTFMLSDNHPPLYYLLLKFSTNIFGFSELGIRMLTVLSGVFSILFSYKKIV